MAEKLKRRIWHSSCLSQVGIIFIAATNKGITDLCISCGKSGFFKMLKNKWGSETEFIEDLSRFKKVFKELERYFSGKPVDFTVPLDLRGTQFGVSVWRALKKIPRGETRTYGEIAKEVQKRWGGRAVGNACGKNPVPILIPCHRVIKGNGELGGYTGGVRIKKMLLKIEGIKF